MLQWFVRDIDIVKEVLSSKDWLVEKSKIKRIEEIPQKCLDESVVTVSQIKKHFTFKAWDILTKLLAKLQKHEWNCTCCYNNLNTSESIGCDACLDWFHLSCLGKVNPKAKYGFVETAMVTVIVIARPSLCDCFCICKCCLIIIIPWCI